MLLNAIKTAILDYLYGKLEPHEALQLRAWLRLRRIRRKGVAPGTLSYKALQLHALHQSNSSAYYVPQKPRCDCPKTLADIREIGNKLFLGYDTGGLKREVCTEAWVRLSVDVKSRGCTPQQQMDMLQNNMVFETQAGQIHVSEDSTKQHS